MIENKKAFVVSFLLAILGIFLIMAYITAIENQLAKKYKPVKVIMANRDIMPGEKLTVSDLNDKSEIPEVILTRDNITNREDAVNRTAVIPITKNTPLLKTFFVGGGVGISNKIPPGMRAYTIPVSKTSAIAEMIQPLDFIDIMVTAETGDNRNRNFKTITILQKVQIMAVNNIYSVAGLIQWRMKQMMENTSGYQRGGNSQIATLTLALTPQETQILNAVQQSGIISVSLRSPKDISQNADILPVRASEIIQEKRVKQTTVSFEDESFEPDEE